MLLLATGITVAAAGIFYRLIEGPCHEFSRSARFARPRK
jgi:peptidoglycan/LPS O-acetylase OafA/YrhL